jgi:hypothetical protein
MFVKLTSLEVQEQSTFFVEIHSEQRSYVTTWSWAGKIDKWDNPASGTSDTQTYS